MSSQVPHGVVFATQNAPKTAQDAPRCAQDAPRRSQDAPKTHQRRPHDLPKTRQDASKTRQDAHKIDFRPTLVDFSILGRFLDRLFDLSSMITYICRFFKKHCKTSEKSMIFGFEMVDVGTKIETKSMSKWSSRRDAQQDAPKTR